MIEAAPTLALAALSGALAALLWLGHLWLALGALRRGRAPGPGLAIGAILRPAAIAAAAGLALASGVTAPAMLAAAAGFLAVRLAATRIAGRARGAG